MERFDVIVKTGRTRRKNGCELQSNQQEKSEMIMICTCATNSKGKYQPKVSTHAMFYYIVIICVYERTRHRTRTMWLEQLSYRNVYGQMPIKVVVVLVQRSKWISRCHSMRVFITWCFMCAHTRHTRAHAHTNYVMCTQYEIYHLNKWVRFHFAVAVCTRPESKTRFLRPFFSMCAAIQYLFNPFTHSLLLSLHLSSLILGHIRFKYILLLYLFRFEDVSNFSSS